MLMKGEKKMHRIQKLGMMQIGIPKSLNLMLYCEKSIAVP